MKITDEKQFSVPVSSFAISASSTGYTLEYSVDGKTWDAFPTAVPASNNLVVNFSPRGLLYRCKGNVGDLFVQY